MDDEEKEYMCLMPVASSQNSDFYDIPAEDPALPVFEYYEELVEDEQPIYIDVETSNDDNFLNNEMPFSEEMYQFNDGLTLHEKEVVSNNEPEDWESNAESRATDKTKEKTQRQKSNQKPQKIDETDEEIDLEKLSKRENYTSNELERMIFSCRPYKPRAHRAVFRYNDENEKNMKKSLNTRNSAARYRERNIQERENLEIVAEHLKKDNDRIEQKCDLLFQQIQQYVEQEVNNHIGEVVMVNGNNMNFNLTDLKKTLNKYLQMAAKEQKSKSQAAKLDKTLEKPTHFELLSIKGLKGDKLHKTRITNNSRICRGKQRQETERRQEILRTNFWIGRDKQEAFNRLREVFKDLKNEVWNKYLAPLMEAFETNGHDLGEDKLQQLKAIRTFYCLQ